MKSVSSPRGWEASNPQAIVQARTGSTRLPGKVLLPLKGQPVLRHVVERLRSCHWLKGVIIATTEQSDDDEIEVLSHQWQIPCFRGSEEDVLDRYYQAALEFKVDPVVRITADCPLIDPSIVDTIVRAILDDGFELYSLGGDFPDGLDCVAFRFSVLRETWQKATLPSDREHVSTFMGRNRSRFRAGVLKPFKGLRSCRWTLDEPRDYEFLKEVYARLWRPDHLIETKEVLRLLEAHPELTAINSGIIRNEGYLRSLRRDPQFEISDAPGADQEPEENPATDLE